MSASRKSPGRPRKGLVICRREAVHLRDLPTAVAALASPGLLDRYWEDAAELASLLGAADPSMDTRLLQGLCQARRLNVLVFGAAGAGKSLLVRTLTNDQSAASSACLEGTRADNPCLLPSGVCLVDTPGITVPGSLGTSRPADPDKGWLSRTVEWGLRRWQEQAEQASWDRRVADLHRRLREGLPESRPLAMIYCHHAKARIMPDRMHELLERAHLALVPCFIVVTDIRACADRELAECQQLLAGLVERIGPNLRGSRVRLHLVNVVSKTVDGVVHPETGLKELVTALLSALDPKDTLTLLRKPGWLFGLKRKPEDQSSQERSSRPKLQA